MLEGSDICIFAHYDRDGRVDPYVANYLSAIKECGFQIVFVTTSVLVPSDRSRLSPLVVDIIERPNIGHDFGSWSDGLARYRDAVSGRLLIANDSVYGPVRSLKDALARLTSQKADVYGMILSQEITPHLQSWFLLFEPHVVHSQAFADVFCQPPRQHSKEDVIRNFELRATTQLLSAGFKVRALHEYGNRRISGNPSAYLWRQLVLKDQVPFLKVGVLRDDPASTVNDADWTRFLARYSPELLPLVRAHLDRVRANTPPTPTDANRHKMRRRTMATFVQTEDFFLRHGMHWATACNHALFQAALRSFTVPARVTGLIAAVSRRLTR